MASTSADSDYGTRKRPLKCGKGLGGQKARFDTQTSPAGSSSGGKPALHHLLKSVSF
eukprot:CAMPEP_0174351906 /NCGR_PEP_ID=MMETSP0811_2-20130205/9430_1 /TAXON_ID=73025 ORGANISM="Eutreptiella gymnastica-like, Strain CCMP1594" /NCGR_SAMPLE_ID=MMETSP0811_2 /ASSEMBLY_ACC=CAM_ASM_000667 /LENGTH=56 /DNA_ID=CAMNT_0015481603 /DNA_START=1 /DNA_END=168 /DNA_ORIENTATION=+